MGVADPRWLEILKASSWQTLAIATACGLFFLGVHAGLLPQPPDWVVLGVGFGFLLCATLTTVGVLNAAFQFFAVKDRVLLAYHQRKDVRELRDYIPHMTEMERTIVAYLLAHNQKTISAAQDGGHALTLISRGVLVSGLRGGQSFTSEDCPFLVPDHLWEVLKANSAEFPYKKPPQPEPHPWRKHWMTR